MLHLGVALGEEVDARDLDQARRKYLRAIDAPAEKPFLQPFRSRGYGLKLDNRNTAGSYAAKSIRPGQALSQVVETIPSIRTSSKVAYRFKPGHADTVLSVMLKGQPVPAAQTAAFLFRDFALRLDPRKPQELLTILRDWLNLGSDNPDGELIFDSLFEDDSASVSPFDFEPVAN
jgi:hypothetical protein